VNLQDRENPPSEAFAMRCERTNSWYLDFDYSEVVAFRCLRKGCRCAACDCDCEPTRVNVYLAETAP
jgi:hypothetical protein